MQLNLKDDPKRTLTKVADMIFNKFIDEGITGISGDLKASTIKRHLSDWGFNLKQLGIKKAIKK